MAFLSRDCGLSAAANEARVQRLLPTHHPISCVDEVTRACRETGEGQALFVTSMLEDYRGRSNIEYHVYCLKICEIFAGGFEMALQDLQE